ncbi:MAG: DUF5916 domain-containing protein [Saprospiraceae bacterium]|nr:carbohydrate binding family 9 domain-containing protein [Lewinella sp.]
MRISPVLFFIYFFLVAISVCAQVEHEGNFPPPDVPPLVRAVTTEEPVRIDGTLDDEIWRKAPVVKDFFRIEPRQGGTYQFATFVQLAFDRKYLYLGVYCRDTLGKKGVRVQDLRRDFYFSENDNFYVCIDAQNTQRSCLCFFTTPFGNQRDAQVFDDTFTDTDWDALWKVKTSVSDSGYVAEYAIPFSTLRYNRTSPGDSTSWGISFSRLARREFEQTAFPAVPQAFSPQRMTYAAQLEGLTLPPPAVNLRLQPYGLYQWDKTIDTGGNSVEDTKVKAGGEIKWALNPYSVLDLTFNTDFAQADVDRAVNNLTRFNVFFPERRQFFLENSGVYAGADITNIKPFFSRTIGLANAQFNAAPIPIDAGIRYTDRDEKRTWAGLYVHQQGTEYQGAANFAVARYLKNYGKQNNMGVMLTHRLDESDPEKGFEAHHNTTLSWDGFIRPRDEITIQYLATASRDNSNDSLGFAASFYAGWFPQKWYMGWWTDVVDSRYTPGMGYIFGQNTVRHNPGGYYIWRPTKGWWSKWIRRQDPGLFVRWYQNAQNLKTQELSLYIFPIYLFTKSNAQIEYALYPYWQNFEESFSILGRTIAAGKYSYFRQQFRYSTDASKKISASVDLEFGGYYSGKLSTLSLGGRVAPLPNIALTLDYEHNRFRDFGMERETFAVDLYTLGLRLAYNPRIQLSTFYQYNSFDERGRWNIRGSWEFAPLSFLYLVFNENTLEDHVLNNRNFISKVSYLKQF